MSVEQKPPVRDFVSWARDCNGVAAIFSWDVLNDIREVDKPVLTGGTRSALHAPDPQKVGAPACDRTMGGWGEIHDAQKFDGWRDWCRCDVCQNYRNEVISNE